jgi:hypothetical protein
VRRVTKIAAGIAAGGLIAAGAATAGAATNTPDHTPYGGNACATGIYSGFCGDQVTTNGLGMTPYRSQVVLRPYSDHNSQQDFFWLQYQGGGNDIAEFAPGGIASDLIMAVVHGQVRLVQAPQVVTAYDEWYFNGTGWTNVGTNTQLGEVNGVLDLTSGPGTEYTFDSP